MRPLEIALLVVLSAPFVAGLFSSAGWRRMRVIAAAGSVGALALHLVLEGSRWTMAPAYALVALLIVTTALSATRADGAVRGAARVLTAAFALLLLAATAMLTAAFPIVHLPEPGGPFAVGTTMFEIRDADRLETLTDDPSDVRAFAVRAWYPADSAAFELPTVRYRERHRTHQPITAHVGGGGLPDFMFSHLRHVRTNSRYDAPPMSGRTSPVLVFSTGFLSPVDDAQILAEAMASRGWVVLSMTHPYESEAVTLGDGSIVSYTDAHAAEFVAHMRMSQPLWEAFTATMDEEERRAIGLRILEEDRFMDRQVRIRAADIRAAIDAFEAGRGAPEELLAAMNLSLLYVAGHSLGGATAGQVLVEDPRFLAGVNMDGFQFGDLAREATLDRPFAMLYSEAFSGVNAFLGERLEHAPAASTVEGAMHIDFTDAPALFPIMRRLGMAGPIGAQAMRDRILDHLLTLGTGIRMGPGTVEVIRGGNRMPLPPVKPRPTVSGP